MSNRFRNLKLTRTLKAGLSTSKLMPFEEEGHGEITTGNTLKVPKDNKNVRFKKVDENDDGRHRRKSANSKTSDLNGLSKNGKIGFED